jgi:hypothetical protein
MRAIMHRRLFLAALAAAAAPAAAQAQPRFVLHEWFRGPTWAVGSFRNRFTGSERKLAVDLSGRWNGRALSLFEDFFYADGERDQKTWVFTRTAEGRYTGTREDVVTPAEVTQPTPDSVRFGYVADLSVGGSVTRLSFDDTLTLRPDGTVLNVATVSRFFIPVGDVELVFRRGRLPARFKRKGGWS